MKIMQDYDYPLSAILHNAVIPKGDRVRLLYPYTSRGHFSLIPQCIKFHNLTFKR